MPAQGAFVLSGIGRLVTNDPELGAGVLGELTDAAVVVQDGRVAWVGASSDAPAVDRLIDVGGRAVVPGFVDAHTHLVFAGERVEEFEARMAGQPWSAGGIAATVGATRAASREELIRRVEHLGSELLSQGTTTVEVKTGYGLDVAHEVRLLEVARTVTEERTFLGAHVVPPEFAHDRDGYVRLVAGAMLEEAAPLARWVDAFCEAGAFDVEECRTVLLAGAAHGLGLRLHANQLGWSPGIQLACELGAASVDHCTHLRPADIDALASSGTVATLVPGAEFSTRSPYAPARSLLDAGVTVALATDCNPGTSYTTSMPFVIALAVRELHLSPAEALWAATAGGAASLRRNDVGRLRPGARADLVVLDAPHPAHLAYRPGVPLAWLVVKDGKVVAGSG
jgi:imidazolonepropionase